MRLIAVRLLLLAAASATLACGGTDENGTMAPEAPSLARATAITGTPTERAAKLATRVNARLAAKGSKYRLTGGYFFTVGKGVPPFRSHNFDARWPYRNLTYLLDASDFTADASAGSVANALVNAYETWDAVSNISLSLSRVADTRANPDVLDGIVLDTQGACVDIVDVTSDALVSYDPATGSFDLDPAADIVQGGWLGPDYFEKCLGSADIIAITWTFTNGDANHDQYEDISYVEQFFNSRWGYVTTGSTYLDFDGPFDIQSIAVHEDGHALGLDHTGGPNDNQPFKLHPNGRVFSPEAVMNPFNLGGEKRSLFPLDLASIRQLYSRPN